MDAGQLIGLSIFASYFVLIFALFLRIVTSLRWSQGKRGKRVFVALTGASFAHTWYYMFKFMSWSFHNYERTLSSPPTHLPAHHRLANWLSATGLFEQAWSAVCTGPTPWSWWWSQQLCLFTAGAWTLFLAVEGRRRNVRHVWAYMLLGQVVAVSVAASLFFYAASLAPPSSNTRRAPPALYLSVLLSLVTVALSPHTSARTFLPNLLVMHALLVLPLVLPSRPGRFALNLKTLRSIVAGLTLLLYLRASVAGTGALAEGERTPVGVLGAVVETLGYHPAQSSIGWDVVWTTVAVLVWRAGEGRGGRGVVRDVLGVVGGSVGFVFVLGDGNAKEKDE